VRTRPTLAESWLSMPWSMRILRAFLGVTFVYAGIQKFLDPNFLHAGSADYIGTQLRGFATNTPVAPLMSVLAKMPLLVGVGIALVELAVGLATLLGVGLMAAAFVGLTINVVLWLSATWHVHPYFLGSDSIYAVAWLALLVGAWEVERLRYPGRVPGIAERVDGLGRREVIRGGIVAAMAIGLAGLGKAFAGVPAKGAGLASARRTGTRPAAGGGTQAAGAGAQSDGGASQVAGPPSASPTHTPPPVRGRTIANLASLPVGSAVGFTGPGGTPAALVRLADGRVVAYSRICTHAGCPVGYDSGAHLLVCPCHGAEFDPARHGAPVPGSPTSTPLAYIRVVVDHANGTVILPQ
jgi:thiosulfate dehydrogenase (quinone) large subunit